MGKPLLATSDFRQALTDAIGQSRQAKGPQCFVCALPAEQRDAIDEDIRAGEGGTTIARALQLVGVAFGPAKVKPQGHHIRDHAARGHHERAK